MNDLFTTILVVIAALLALGACVIMLLRLRRDQRSVSLRRTQHTLLGSAVGLSLLTFAYRMAFVYGDWRPLHAHVDGLLLIAVLLGAAALFLQRGRRLPEFTGFATPVIALSLAWAFCAGWWTFEAFAIDSIWKLFHLAAVYVGAILVALAAAAGAMYLVAERRVRRKEPSNVPRLAPLEAIERIMIGSATGGFAMLTLGLVTGLVIVTDVPNKIAPGWWHSPKIILSALAWVIYALLMNVRHASQFRGVRAAWLSIAGLACVLAAFAAVQSLDSVQTHQPDAPPATSLREAPP